MKNPLISLLLLVFAACNNTKTTDVSTTSIDSTTLIKTPEKDTIVEKSIVQDKLDPIINSYLELKNALVKDDSKLAASSGKKLETLLDNIDKNGMSKAQIKLFNELKEDARENAEHIGDNSGKIAHQREHFEMLSEDIYQMVKEFDTDQKLFYDHCPMYNDGKGANWISETKSIANPYYGNKMLKCGKIKEEI